MKKILALALAALMCLSLCACSSSVDSDSIDEILTKLDSIQETLDSMTAEDTEEDAAEAEETEVAETVDFEWNGQMEVWSILPTTGAEGLVMINDAMGAVMEAEGFTYVKKDAQGDPSAQVSFVEDAIAAGNVGALMIAAMDVDLLKDVVGEALDAGIAVAMLGAEPTDYTISGCVYTAYEITGMYAVQAAEDWVTQRVAEGGDIPTNEDGKYEIACDTYYDIADGVYRSQAMIGTVENSDILTLVSETTSYGESAYSDAYDNAQDVLNANPDCHIFIAYEPEEAMGAADAIDDYVDQNGGDLADYCVIPCYAEDTTFTELYEGALEDASSTAIKGYSTYGDAAIAYGDEARELVGASYDALAEFAQAYSEDVIIVPALTGEHLADILLSACGFEDYEFAPGYGGTFYDTITAVNVYGFEQTWKQGEENPASEYKTLE